MRGSPGVPAVDRVTGVVHGLRGRRRDRVPGVQDRGRFHLVDGLDPVEELLEALEALCAVALAMYGIEFWDGPLARFVELDFILLSAAAVAPLLHGLLAFGLGCVAHLLTGFSPGGVILLAVIAGSSSDISGPPTLRAAIPSANPSAYIGASTSIGTPIAIAVGIPLYIALGEAVFGF